MSGRSQAVRLPKEFRFDTKEVWIRRNPDTGEIILKPKPDLPEGFQNGLQVFMHEMAQLRQELGDDWEPLEIEPREPLPTTRRPFLTAILRNIPTTNCLHLL